MGFANSLVGTEGEMRIPAIRSRNWIEGLQGWRIGSDGKAEYTGLTVRGTLGADTISADSLSLSGLDIGPHIASEGGSVVGWGDHTANSPISNVETGYGEIAAPMKAGRLYLLVTTNVRVVSTVASDIIDVRIRITEDGSTPTPSSPLLQGMLGIRAGNPMPPFIRLHRVGIDRPKVRYLLTVQRASGTGDVSIDASATTGKRVQMALIDLGTRAPNDVFVVNNSTSTTTSTATNTVKTTNKYPAVWSNTFRANGEQRTDKDGNLTTYQGYFDGTNGDQRSLVGFDFTKIMNDLSGATIDECLLTYKVQHAGSSTGLDVIVASHNYTSKPTTWDSVNVKRDRGRTNDVLEGSSATLNLGTAIGDELKSGATRGFGFGPSGDNSRVYERYGYLYGAGTSAKPYLTITYTK